MQALTIEKSSQLPLHFTSCVELLDIVLSTWYDWPITVQALKCLQTPHSRTCQEVELSLKNSAFLFFYSTKASSIAHNLTTISVLEDLTFKAD